MKNKRFNIIQSLFVKYLLTILSITLLGLIGLILLLYGVFGQNENCYIAGNILAFASLIAINFIKPKIGDDNG